MAEMHYTDITPEELYWLDRYRGSNFTGPTAEELFEGDEADFLLADYFCNYGLTALAERVDLSYLTIEDSRK